VLLFNIYWWPGAALFRPFYGETLWRAGYLHSSSICQLLAAQRHACMRCVFECAERKRERDTLPFGRRDLLYAENNTSSRSRYFSCLSPTTTGSCAAFLLSQINKIMCVTRRPSQVDDSMQWKKNRSQNGRTQTCGLPLEAQVQKCW
jgi:hypothetical protein